MITKFFILFITFVALKIIYNLYYFLIAKKYYQEYIKFVKTDSNSWFIRENKQKIIKLFLRAGIEDSHQPNTELAGYGMVATGNISVFRNLSILREDIVTIINGDFREAIGIYKQRIFESFNPIYWVEFLIFLPRIIFKFLGINVENFFIKLAQLLWWLFGFAGLISSVFFNKEFTQWIMSII